ncbi:MAG: hypothetical protein ACJ8GN_04460 [Longimicrobiaceae bacterium]
MRIDLTPDLESALTNAARRQGTTPELLAQAYLRERLEVVVDDVHETCGTLADFLEGYVGVLPIGDEVEGGTRLSEDTGRRFTEVLAQRREAGRL